MIASRGKNATGKMENGVAGDETFLPTWNNIIIHQPWNSFDAD